MKESHEENFELSSDLEVNKKPKHNYCSLTSVFAGCWSNNFDRDNDVDGFQYSSFLIKVNVAILCGTTIMSKSS